ncbi:MAG: carboxylesterase family protein [Lachnospiraceae bacterium]|nr:carboxylesterase family protein [Lachnospiraceae bacterium]
MNKKTVKFPCGAVTGNRTDWGYEFLGIPYGRAERFCPPRSVTWKGDRDCTAYGAPSLQPNFLGVHPEGMEFSAVGSEDCLFLNVWTKHLNVEDCCEEWPVDAVRRPVVIYIHGGAFQVGSGGDPARSGEKFIAERDFVFVSVNYRLGVLGFLRPEEGAYTWNNGARDVLLAVEWVQKNICAFGGDPDNIILMGISAGAKILGSLLTRPEIQTSCRKVILESGAMQSFRDCHTAETVWKEYCEYLPEGKSMEELTGEEIVRAQAAFCDREGSTCFFGPVCDEEFFFSDWEERWKHGQAWHGSAVLGSGRRELAGQAGSEAFRRDPEPILFSLFGENGNLARARYEALPEGEESWIRVLSDFMYRSYTDALAEALWKEDNPVWVYSFEFLPARHGMGFHFLMNQWDNRNLGVEEERLPEAEHLAAQMRREIRDFIETGRPGESWELYEGVNKRIYGSDVRMERREKDSLTVPSAQAYVRR